MAQASGLKGRWSGHGEAERHLGWCRSTWPKRPPRARYKAKFPATRLFVSAKKIGARKANAGNFFSFYTRSRAASGPRTKEALSTGWAARLCCEQRGRLAAVSSQPRGVRQRVQAVGSARECARERATRERSGSQSSSVYACGHSPRGAIARVLGPTKENQSRERVQSCTSSSTLESTVLVKKLYNSPFILKGWPRLHDRHSNEHLLLSV